MSEFVTAEVDALVRAFARLSGSEWDRLGRVHEMLVGDTDTSVREVSQALRYRSDAARRNARLRKFALYQWQEWRSAAPPSSPQFCAFANAVVATGLADVLEDGLRARMMRPAAEFLGDAAMSGAVR